MTMLNLKIDVYASQTTADFSLTVQVYDGNQPVATLAHAINVDDPNLGQRLRDLFQAFRMGAQFGVPQPVVTYDYTPDVAGSDLPPRDNGVDDATAIIHHAR